MKKNAIRRADLFLLCMFFLQACDRVDPVIFTFALSTCPTIDFVMPSEATAENISITKSKYQPCKDYQSFAYEEHGRPILRANNGGEFALKIIRSERSCELIFGTVFFNQCDSDFPVDQCPKLKELEATAKMASEAVLKSSNIKLTVPPKKIEFPNKKTFEDYCKTQ